MDLLSDNIVVEIFSYLDHKNLQNAMEVCQRWSSIITNSSSLKRRFKLKIFLRKYAFLIRRYYPSEINENITIDMSAPCNNIHPEISNLIEKQSKYLKTLTLKDFFESNAFQVLKMTPNITKLILINVRHDNTEDFLDLPNLQHLELINSLGIAKFITTTHHLKTVKIMGGLSILMKKRKLDVRYDQSTAMKAFDATLSGFLARCVNLKEFWISNVPLNPVVLDNSQFTFRLDTFMIENIDINEDNLLEFLKNQKSSLKNFSIMADVPKSKLMNFALFEMTLEEFEIDVAIIPKDFHPKKNKSPIKRIFFNSYKVQDYLQEKFYKNNHCDYKDPRAYFDNRQIDFCFVKNKTRVFKNKDDRDYFITPFFLRDWDCPEKGGHAESAALVRKILSACPAVESALFYNLYSPKILVQLNTSCKNLKTLKLFEVPKTISPQIYFENLESIEIDHVDPEKEEECKNLITLASKCPNLRSLKIHDFGDDYKKVLFKFANEIKNLEELHVGGSYQFLSSITEGLKVAKEQGSKLKCLSFVANFIDSEYSHNISGMEVYGVKMIFHQLFRKVFTSIYHECRLGSMQKRIGTKIAKLREICYKTLNEDQTG